MSAKIEMNENRFDTVTLLEYKGIFFDDWTIDDETGGIWGEMCQYCAEKYGAVLEQELSLGGIGACSVEGCSEVGFDNDAPGHYYVDFDPALVNFVQAKREQKLDIHTQIHNVKNKQHSFTTSYENQDRILPER